MPWELVFVKEFPGVKSYGIYSSIGIQQLSSSSFYVKSFLLPFYFAARDMWEIYKGF